MRFRPAVFIFERKPLELEGLHPWIFQFPISPFVDSSWLSYIFGCRRTKMLMFLWYITLFIRDPLAGACFTPAPLPLNLGDFAARRFLSKRCTFIFRVINGHFASCKVSQLLFSKEATLNASWLKWLMVLWTRASISLIRIYSVIHLPQSSECSIHHQIFISLLFFFHINLPNNKTNDGNADCEKLKLFLATNLTPLIITSRPAARGARATGMRTMFNNTEKTYINQQINRVWRLKTNTVVHHLAITCSPLVCCHVTRDIRLNNKRYQLPPSAGRYWTCRSNSCHRTLAFDHDLCSLITYIPFISIWPKILF